MKRGVKINFQFSNRVLYSLITFLVLAIVSVGVYAYGTSSPSVFGHSAGEVDVTVGGVTKTLQAAIDDKSLGGGGSFPDITDVSGKVGIGTANPQVALDVGGAGTTRLNALSNPQAFFGSGGNAAWGGVAVGMGLNGNKPFIASTKDGNGIQLSLSINPNGGNVGIGTTAPSSTLGVLGSLTLQRTPNLATASGRGSPLILQSPSNQPSAQEIITAQNCQGVNTIDFPNGCTDGCNGNTQDHYTCTLTDAQNSKQCNDVYSSGGVASIQKIGCVSGTTSYKLVTDTGTLNFVNNDGATTLTLDQNGFLNIFPTVSPTEELLYENWGGVGAYCYTWFDTGVKGIVSQVTFDTFQNLEGASIRVDDISVFEDTYLGRTAFVFSPKGGPDKNPITTSLPKWDTIKKRDTIKFILGNGDGTFTLAEAGVADNYCLSADNIGAIFLRIYGYRITS